MPRKPRWNSLCSTSENGAQVCYDRCNQHSHPKHLLISDEVTKILRGSLNDRNGEVLCSWHPSYSLGLWHWINEMYRSLPMQQHKFCLHVMCGSQYTVVRDSCISESGFPITRPAESCSSPVVQETFLRVASQRKNRKPHIIIWMFWTAMLIVPTSSKQELTLELHSSPNQTQLTTQKWGWALDT